tara:strand:+ start:4370 stop:4573 length:204 start_codon:yes stop_codon:yes gene_type:complete
MNIGKLVRKCKVNRKIREAKREVAKFDDSIEPDKPSYDPVEEAGERGEFVSRFKDYLDKKCDYGLIK